MSVGITLNSDNTLTDNDIDPNYPAGSITDFNGQCEGYMWVIPALPHGGPRMYTADNLKQIAQILDNANSANEPQ